MERGCWGSAVLVSSDSSDQGNVRKSEDGEGLDGRDRLEPAGDRADGDVSVVHYSISRALHVHNEHAPSLLMSSNDESRTSL